MELGDKRAWDQKYVPLRREERLPSCQWREQQTALWQLAEDAILVVGGLFNFTNTPLSGPPAPLPQPLDWPFPLASPLLSKQGASSLRSLGFSRGQVRPDCRRSPGLLNNVLPCLPDTGISSEVCSPSLGRPFPKAASEVLFALACSPDFFHGYSLKIFPESTLAVEGAADILTLSFSTFLVWAQNSLYLCLFGLVPSARLSFSIFTLAFMLITMDIIER